MYRVCAVCGENVRPKLNEFLDAHGFQPAGEDCDVILFCSGKPPASWEEKVRTAARTSAAGIVVLVKKELAEETQKQLAGCGAAVFASDLSAPALAAALRAAAATGERLRAADRENERLKEKLGDTKLVSRAKCVLIQYLNMTEAEAHRFIEKRAMDRRVTGREVALDILKMYES